MTGRISIKIKDSNNSYSFELKRNITIFCGDSGRGKTTLFEIVEDYNRYGKSSASRVVCNKSVIAFRGDDIWKLKLENISDSIVIIDEDSTFIRSKEFAEAIKGSDNYYLLITRDYLEQLPISVEEIYELDGQKNKKFKRVYKGTYYLYNSVPSKLLPFKPEIIITEDSKSGYHFFKALANRSDIECVSAQGKSNIYNVLTKYRNKKVLIIADGAAFGSEIRDITERQKLLVNKIGIFLPESFEWLILKSGVVCEPEQDIIQIPEDYAESKIYFSWEQYFTALLVEKTNESYLEYNKKKLNTSYLQEKEKNTILEVLPDIIL